MNTINLPIIKIEWLWWLSPPIFTIICTVYTAIQNPKGSINTFLIHCIDIVLVVWPATPENYKIGFMLTAFSNQFPSLGWSVISEILSGVIGILLIASSIKLLKYIPFF